MIDNFILIQIVIDNFILIQYCDWQLYIDPVLWLTTLYWSSIVIDNFILIQYCDWQLFFYYEYTIRTLKFYDHKASYGVSMYHANSPSVR